MASCALTCLGTLLMLLGGVLACPPGFFLHDNYCYLIPLQTSTWSEAKMFCQALRADLAIVESAEEHRMLVNYIKSHSGALSDRAFWLDGVDYMGNGQWVWMRTLEKIHSFHWADGEPNSRTKAQCLVMWAPKGLGWADEPCAHQWHFVCEMSNEENPVVG